MHEHRSNVMCVGEGSTQFDGTCRAPLLLSLVALVESHATRSCAHVRYVYASWLRSFSFYQLMTSLCGMQGSMCTAK